MRQSLRSRAGHRKHHAEARDIPYFFFALPMMQLGTKLIGPESVTGRHW
jgi:hypothetical protein